MSTPDLLIEWDHAVLKATDEAPFTHKPRTSAVCDVLRVGPAVMRLRCLAGGLTRTQMWQTAQALKLAGARVLYAACSEFPPLPGAEVIATGEWAEHWRVDLDQLRDRRRSGRGAPCG